MSCLALIGLTVVIMFVLPFIIMGGPIIWGLLLVALIVYLVMRERKT